MASTPIDTSSYEAITLTGSAADIAAMAAELAGSGMVGTRVAGSATAHGVAIAGGAAGSGSASALLTAGYVPVGGYFSSDETQAWFIFEK